MAFPKKKTAVQEVTETSDVVETSPASLEEQKTVELVVEKQTKSPPDWQELRNMIHAANWDTTLYSSDLDKVWEIAVQGGAEAVASIPWLGYRHLYVSLVESFLGR